MTSAVTQPDHEFEVQDILINMGPQHPATHGVFRMVLAVDGEIVRDLVPYIGYMHRGGEKLSETMDFRQGIGFMDRTEYLGQFNAELSYVMAVEKLMDIIKVARPKFWLILGQSYIETVVEGDARARAGINRTAGGILATLHVFASDERIITHRNAYWKIGEE